MTHKNCLFRIDDRLIHGQVVIGWCKPLQIQRLILCDDEVATSEFEQQLYACCPEEGQELSFLDADSCARELSGDPERKTIVVMPDPGQARRLCDAGLVPGEITIGGMHDKSGARRLLDYVYLDAADEEALRELKSRGVHLTCRSLPTVDPVELDSLLP